MLCLETQYSPCTTKVEIIETVREEAELRSEVERATMEEERQVLEEAIRVSAERQAMAEAMRVKRERQVEAEWQADDEEAVWMEAERRAAPSSSVSDCVRLTSTLGSVSD